MEHDKEIKIELNKVYHFELSNLSFDILPTESIITVLRDGSLQHHS